jgi:hypothetical protein
MSGDPSLRDAVLVRLAAFAERGLERVNVEVDREQVTLWVRGGRLCASCTCGDAECAHFWAVLPLLSEGPTSFAPVERARTSSRPPPPGEGARGLAEAFDELSLSVARAGIAHADSPSITQAVEQLIAAAPSPLPLLLARWIGRLRAALDAADVTTCARLLHGALRAVDQRRRGGDGGALLGEPSHPGALADVHLLEVAREWLAGLDRASIERRYLLDPSTGAIYAEERRCGEHDCSVGPCPRSAHVAFAEVDTSALPTRVRLLQYTLSLQLPADAWSRVVARAEPSIAALRARFVEETAASPALAEPFALLAPARLEDGPAGALRDLQGEQLALRDEHGDDMSGALHATIAGSELACVLGRLHGGAAGLALVPLSAIVRRGAGYALHRVT